MTSVLAFLTFAQAQDRCIGYLKAGDVAVRCSNGIHQITHHGDARQFAFSDDAAVLVLETDTARQRQFEVVSIKSRTVEKYPWRANGGLSASCGTVTLRESRGDNYQMWDFASGRVFSIGTYTDFSCSTNRATVAGLVGSSPVVLEIGTPPDVHTATAPKPNLIQFSLSSNGTQITYATAEMKLCVAATTGAPACTSIPQYPIYGLSVRDDGTVLYSVSDEACVYRHLDTVSHDDCNRMYRWRAGLAKAIPEGVGGDPQWLSPTQASKLIAYSKGKPQ